MGSLTFYKGDLADHLHELVGYKGGIAVSIEQMCDLLSDTMYADDIIYSEENGIRIRSENYEELYYHLLFKVGVTEETYGGISDIFDLTRKHIKKYGEDLTNRVFKIFQQEIYSDKSIVVRNDIEYIDPTYIIRKAENELGINGVMAMMELIEEFDKLQRYNPHSFNRYQAWDNIINLSDLFESHQKTGDGHFFDQRFINFLSTNQEKLGQIHWRKFEELIAECFTRFGYKVELGPGSNDDGVDLRAWNNNTDSTPEYIIQCKRQKEKINKVTIKGLYADVLHENAKRGLLVTTSEFSIGATNTVKAREYPIEEVNGEMIKKWLVSLRVPGSGIVRV